MNKRRYVVIAVIVVAVVLIAVLLDMKLANHQPVITSLEAPEKVIPSGSCQVVCTASDSDGDELSYEWSASGGEINGEGDTITWTAPNSAGYYDVTVTVTDGRGGEIMSQKTIEARINLPPIITNLVADVDWTTPAGILQVTCTASDLEGDELSYEWSTTGGDIFGTGAAVNWTAPQEIGQYDITVVVSDSHDMEDTGSVILSVSTGTPPTVERLVVTPNGHTYLRKCSKPACDYDVWKIREYYIECDVSDMSYGVIYDWSCDEGQIIEISEDGSMITWTAPDKTLTRATVTILVSDYVDNSVAKFIIFYVPSCACGSWGLKSGEILF